MQSRKLTLAVLMLPLHNKLRRPTSGPPGTYTSPPCTVDPSQTYFSVPRTQKDVTELASLHANQANAKPEYERQHTWESFFFFPQLPLRHTARPALCRPFRNLLQSSCAEHPQWTLWKRIKYPASAPKERDMGFERRSTWGNRPMIFHQTANLQGFHRQSLISRNHWKIEGSAIVLRSSSCSIVAASGPHWMEAQQKTGYCVLWATQRNCPHELNPDPEYLDWRTCKTCQLFLSHSSRSNQKVPRRRHVNIRLFR